MFAGIPGFDSGLSFNFGVFFKLVEKSFQIVSLNVKCHHNLAFLKPCPWLARQMLPLLPHPVRSSRAILQSQWDPNPWRDAALPMLLDARPQHFRHGCSRGVQHHWRGRCITSSSSQRSCRGRRANSGSAEV